MVILRIGDTIYDNLSEDGVIEKLVELHLQNVVNDNIAGWQISVDTIRIMSYTLNSDLEFQFKTDMTAKHTKTGEIVKLNSVGRTKNNNFTTNPSLGGSGEISPSQIGNTFDNDTAKALQFMSSDHNARGNEIVDDLSEGKMVYSRFIKFAHSWWQKFISNNKSFNKVLAFRIFPFKFGDAYDIYIANDEIRKDQIRYAIKSINNANDDENPKLKLGSIVDFIS